MKKKNYIIVMIIAMVVGIFAGVASRELLGLNGGMVTGMIITPTYIVLWLSYSGFLGSKSKKKADDK